VATAADQPGLRSDATGRRLAYLPAATLGNGALLVTLSARGEVERLLWPHVDGPDNLGELRLAMGTEARDVWLDDGAVDWCQEWLGDVSVLRTTVSTLDGTVTIEDAVDPAEPVLVRRVEGPPGTVVVACAPRLAGGERFTGAFVDPVSRAVVFYRRDAALAIALDVPIAGAEVEPADGPGDDVAHVGPVRGRLEGAHDGVVHVVAALGMSPFEALARARVQAAEPVGAWARRREADLRVLTAVPSPGDPDPALARLVDRSVLVLEQLADHATGAIVAAPEMDERFAESGGYGFVWPRDLAYVVLGLLATGRFETAAAALRWLGRVQTEEGLWLHRHWTTGELAPSWGLHQLDETGIVLFAAEAAWEQSRDEQLDRELWPSIRRGADFLVSFVDPANGLPRASVDVWEQQDGQHTYTAAAVVGGLRAAARAAERHDADDAALAYRTAAGSIAGAIDAVLWDPKQGRYVRAVNVARNDGGEAPGTAFERALPYPNRRVLRVAPVDATLDCSLLGLAWPFRALDPGSARLRATVAAVAEGLGTPGGGLHRQERDTYAGGHEWLLATLWLGLAQRLLDEDDALGRAVAHVVSRRTPLDLLAEQVDPDGRPAWVLPLGWSHAMLLLAAMPELRLVEELGRGCAGDGRGG
jgi:hypothetical protein